MAQAMWICQSCGKTMNLNNQAGHLAGKPHANAIAAANANGPAAQAVPPMVNPPVPAVVGGPIRGARRRRERGQVRGQVRGRGRGRGARGRGGNPGGAMYVQSAKIIFSLDDSRRMLQAAQRFA